MTAPEPAAVPDEMWWSPSLARQPHLRPGFILREDGRLLDGRGIGIGRDLPADSVRLHSRPECTALCRDVEQDRDALLAEVEQLRAGLVPDTGQARDLAERFAERLDGTSEGFRLGLFGLERVARMLADEVHPDTGQAPDVAAAVVAAAVAWKARYDEMFDEPPARGTTMRPIYDALLGADTTPTTEETTP